MRSTAFQLLSLSAYEISPDQGFLPPDPLEDLPDCPTLNHLGRELPKLLSARMVRTFIDEQPQLLPSISPSWRDEAYRAVMRVLSFAGHAYVWEAPDQPSASLPPQLAKPWYEVARRLGRPPVLSYASYALDNWRRLDPAQPVQLGNIVLLQNFLGGQDEEWFVLIHIQIERQAGPGLAGLLRAMNGAANSKDDEVLLGLTSLAAAQTAMRDTLLRMKERCDPYMYYNRVALYPRMEEQSVALTGARIRGYRGLRRAAAAVSRRDRRTEFHRALPRRGTRYRPCARSLNRLPAGDAGVHAPAPSCVSAFAGASCR